MESLEQVVEAEVQKRVAAALEKAAAVPTVFTVPEACAAMRVSRSTLYKMIEEGEVARTPAKRRVLIPASEVARFLNAEGAA